ncbi:MAG: TA system VapC family ribonuclease toxin [Bryobacter sp.]|nr:TA system VapC family ribonuclease toxin [Bryobacter sp.]
MYLLDANILLYSFDESSVHYRAINGWLYNALESGIAIGIPWLAAWAFIRITTNQRTYPKPLTAQEAIQAIQVLLKNQNVTLVDPGPRHLEYLQGAMVLGQVRGTSTTDAALAALALELNATMVTADRGFRRFPKLKLLDPSR